MARFILDSVIDLDLQHKNLEKLVKALVQKLLKPDSRVASSKELYIFHSVKQENLALFKLLAKQGNLRDSRELNGDSVLHLIAEKESEFSQLAIEFLGAAQFDFDAQNQKGQTALFNSLKRKHIKNALLLVKHTQNFLYQNPKSGYTYLHLAVYLNNLQLIRVIGKRSEKSFNLKNKKGLTAMEMAQDEAKVVLLALEEQFIVQKNSFVKAPSLDDL